MSIIKKENDFLAQVFYDRLAYFFVKKLKKTNIHPTHLNLSGLGIDIIAGIFFFFGSWIYLIIGGLLVQVALLIDRMDGQLARAKGVASKYGQLLDEGLGVVGMSAIFLGAIGGYFNKTGHVWVWYVGFAGLIGLLMMNLFAHLSKEIYGKNNKAGQKIRDKLNKKLKNNFHPRLFAFSADIQRGSMSLSGFINYAPLFLWVFSILGNLYWIARFFVYKNR